jgi:hypothetical protein
MHKLLKTYLVFLFLVCSTAYSYARVTICHLPSLNGFDEGAIIAKSVLPSETTEVDKLAIFITNRTPLGEEGFYYHSNFKSDGSEYVTKVGGDDVNLKQNVQLVVQNIIGIPTLERHGLGASDVERLFEENVTVYLDKTMINADGSVKIDLGNVKNVRVVDTELQQSVAFSGESINTTGSPPPILLRNISGCCLFSKSNSNANEIARTMKSVSVKTKDIKLLNIARDGTAERIIKENSELSKIDIGMDPAKYRSIDDIKNIFARHEGETVFMVGHNEAGNYVIRDAENVQFSVPIVEIHNIAREYDIKLIDVSCSTARTLAENVPFGVIDQFRASEALQRFADVRLKAENLEQLMSGLASDSIKIVVDEKTFKQTGWFSKRSFFESDVMSRTVAGIYAVLGKISVVNYR